MRGRLRLKIKTFAKYIWGNLKYSFFDETRLLNSVKAKAFLDPTYAFGISLIKVQIKQISLYHMNTFIIHVHS